MIKLPRFACLILIAAVTACGSGRSLRQPVADESMTGRIVSSRVVSMFEGDVAVETVLYELKPLDASTQNLSFVVEGNECPAKELVGERIQVTLTRKRLFFALRAGEPDYTPTDLVATSCEPLKTGAN